ncbi:MAG: phosphate acyltransferase PlsX [Elusimicrobia bacterium]|nr:phosphate acyltransferase PlsX [Elusimicrobiota bacterium]MBU2615418.1 phosphate acyltransferase PlsX [Elusimicrobiota bacterium]
MTIALDAMGGDHGIPTNIEGAVLAAKKLGLKIVLAGDELLIGKELSKYKYDKTKISIQPATEVITMEDAPSAVLRQKKDSSIGVAVNLVATGSAQAVVSAGNSGAVMAASLLSLKPLQYVTRPAITTVFPTLRGVCVVLDVGANVNCKPKNLLQFAIMGNIYVKEIFGIASPRIGLISIGEEKTKGNELTLGAYDLLETSNLNFIGNIEGRDIPQGNVDVAVCDGFVGNVILKLSEGIADMLFKLIKSEIKKHPFAIAALPFLWGALKDLRKSVDYTEYGGAPLLGINGTCIICHGGSNSKAIMNALKYAGEVVEKDINSKISKEMEKFQG